MLNPVTLHRPRIRKSDDGRPSSRRRLLLLLLLLSLTIAGALQSLALFTSSTTTDHESIATGSVRLNLTNATTTINAANLAPGDTTTATLWLINDGTLDLRYAMTTTVLSASVTSGDARYLPRELTVAVGTSCGLSDITSGTLDTIHFGSDVQGAQAGDRSLAPGVSERVCVAVTLPSDADNRYQSQSTTATFTFAAEQTKNN